MTDVLIRRDLLEDLRDAANDCLNHEIMRGNDRNVPAYTELVEQADAALSAPRQPEGEGLAWKRKEGVLGCKRYMTQKCYDAQSPQMKDNYEPLICAQCTDAQRAIAELRAQLHNTEVRLTGMTYDRNCRLEERDTLRRDLALSKAAYEAAERDHSEAAAERDTLRQQRDKLAAALERIADTDPDAGTAWFHEVADAALAEVGQ